MLARKFKFENSRDTMELLILVQKMEMTRKKINKLSQEVPLTSKIMIEASVEYDDLYTRYRSLTAQKQRYK